MKMDRDTSESPPSQRSYSPPIPPKPAAVLRKKTLAKKSAVASIPALPKNNSSLSYRMENLKKSQLQLLDWQSEGGDFISLSGCYDSGYQGSLDLEDEINKFLSDQRKTVMLLAGNSGAGKSLFTQGFVAKLWAKYKEGDPIPIWISLPNCKDPETKATEGILLNAGFDHEQIATLRDNHRVIFIFDAYDEIRSSKNLWVTNNLGQWNAKIIFTCRHEYLYWIENFKNLFTPIVDDRLDHEASQVLYVKPFSPEQIEGYVKQYIRRHHTVWRRWEEYQRGFEEIPGLKELIQTPCVLKLAVEALPEIMMRYESVEAEKKKDLTKAVLYDVFVDQWFARQERKLKDNGVISEEEPIREEFWNYAISLASMMHQRQIVQVLYEPSEADIFDVDAKIADENPFSRFFDPSLPKVQLFQNCCFIKRTGLNHFAFEHASIFDFFVSKSISDASLNKVRNQRRITIYQPKEESLNVALCTETQVNLLAERVKETEEFKQYLLDWLYASRNNAQYSNASANSITILVKAGITFNGADLSYLHLRGANISGGYFDRANFEGSDLENVKMHRVWMRQANLRRCNLKGVDFGEYSWVEHDDKVQSMVYLEGLNRLFTSSGKNIFEWDSITKKCMNTFENKDEITCFDISKNGQIIVSCNASTDVTVCHINKFKRVKYLHHDYNVRCVGITDNGTIMALGCDDGSLVIWNMITLNNKKYNVSKSRIDRLDLCSEGNVIVTLSRSELIVLMFDTKIVERMKLNDVEIFYLNYKGTILVTSQGERINNEMVYPVRVWDLLSGSSKVYKGHKEKVTSLYLSSDDNWILSGSDDKTIRIWNYCSDDAKIMYGHDSRITSLTMTSDMQRVISASWDNTVRFWDINSAILYSEKETDEVIDSIGICRNRLICISKKNNDYFLMDYLNKSKRRIATYYKFISNSIVSADGKFVLFNSAQSAELIDVISEKIIYRDQYSFINNVFISSNGNVVVVCENDKVTVINVVLKNKRSFSGQINIVKSICCNHDGSTVALGDYSGRFLLCDFSKRKTDLLYADANGYATAICMSENGEIVICCFHSNNDDKYNNIIRVHYIKTGSSMQLLGHDDIICCVSLSTDSTMLVSGSQDKTIRLWDIQSGNEKATIQVKGPIKNVRLNEDMSLIAVNLFDGDAELWEKLDQEGEIWQLKWSSDIKKSLHLANCDFRYSKGLSQNNQHLLSQRYVTLNDNDAVTPHTNIEPAVASVTRKIRGPIGSAMGRVYKKVTVQDNNEEDNELFRNPPSVQLLKASPDEILQRAENMLQSGKYSLSLESFDEAIRMDPRNPIYYNSRATVYLALGNFDYALNDCDRALALMPHYASARLNRSNVNFYFGKFEYALSDLEASFLQLEIIKDYPTMSFVLAFKAYIFLCQNLLDSASTLIDEATKISSYRDSKRHIKTAVKFIHVSSVVNGLSQCISGDLQKGLECLSEVSQYVYLAHEKCEILMLIAVGLRYIQSISNSLLAAVARKYLNKAKSLNSEYSLAIIYLKQLDSFNGSVYTLPLDKCIVGDQIGKNFNPEELDTSITSGIMDFLSMPDCIRLSSCTTTMWEKSKGILLLKALKENYPKESIDHLAYLADVIDISGIFRDKNIDYYFLARVLIRAEYYLDSYLKKESDIFWLLSGICGLETRISMVLEGHYQEFAAWIDREKALLIGIVLGGNLEHLKIFTEKVWEKANREFIIELIGHSLVGGDLSIFNYLRTKYKNIFMQIFFEDDSRKVKNYFVEKAVRGGSSMILTALVNDYLIMPSELFALYSFCGQWQLYDISSENSAIDKDYYGYDSEVIQKKKDMRRLVLATEATITGNLKLLSSLNVRVDKLNPQDAVESGSSDMFWYFVNNNLLSINDRFRLGDTVLHILARRGHYTLFRNVLKKGGDKLIFVVNDSKQSVVHSAAEGGHANIYNFLIKHFYINKRLPVDKNGDTPVDFARKVGNVWFLKRLKQSTIVQVVEQAAPQTEHVDSNQESTSESKLIY